MGVTSLRRWKDNKESGWSPGREVGRVESKISGSDISEITYQRESKNGPF